MKSQVSYASGATQKPEKVMTIESVLDIIKSDTLAAITNKIRLEHEKKIQTTLKIENLPVISTSGTFNGAFKKECLDRYSNLFQLDFDNINDPDNIISALKQDKFIFALWLSVRGKGVKAIMLMPE